MMTCRFDRDMIPSYLVLLDDAVANFKERVSAYGPHYGPLEILTNFGPYPVFMCIFFFHSPHFLEALELSGF